MPKSKKKNPQRAGSYMERGDSKVLRYKYLSGEITKEQYNKQRAKLEKKK